MYFDASTIFDNEVDLVDQLNQIDFSYYQDELKDIFEYLKSSKDLMNEYGPRFLEYFLSSSMPLDTKSKLTYINAYCPSNMINDDIRHLIFNFAFKIYDTKQDQEDVELHRLLCYILSTRCKRVCSEDDFKHLVSNSLIEKNKIRRKQHDDVIENYLANPAIHPPKQTDLDINTMTMFSLFNIVYESTMRRIEFQGMETINFSDRWLDILRHVKDSRFKTRSEIHINYIEASLRRDDPNDWVFDRERENAIQAFDETTNFGCMFNFTDKDEYVMTLKEGIQSLKSAHPRFIITIACALNCLIQSNNLPHNLLTEEELLDNAKLIDTVYYSKLQTLLTDIAFEFNQYATSCTLRKLIRIAACCYALGSRNDFPVAIWDNFYTLTTTFLETIESESNPFYHRLTYEEISRIERIIFTMTLGTSSMKNYN